MWGGEGHTWAHAVVKYEDKKFCIQVHSAKIADAPKWRAEGDHWAKKHGTEIHDGKCDHKKWS